MLIMKMSDNILRLRIGQYASFVICLMLMLIVPIWKDHKIFGIELGSKDREEKFETLSTMSDGTVIINTTEIGKDITGYAGPTPIEIQIKDGHIEKIKALPNQETPEFFGAVRNSDLLESLDGLSLEEALNAKIDGVTGATYSSNSVKDNIKIGISYAINAETEIAAKQQDSGITLKFYITLLIILAGGIIPFFLKDKRYRTLQLILNVLLLGFWGGTFLSYSLMTSYLINGITRIVMIPTALMLIAAFIYPMFGKKNYYCSWMCPYGSLQELLGNCVKYKFKMSARLLKGLNIFRDVLWFVLMWLLWTGLWFDWMGYEPFAAFFFKDASAVTLGIAGGFLVLSFFIRRPYCRFVCPTGTLFKLSEGSK